MEDRTDAGAPTGPEIRHVAVRCGGDPVRIPVDRLKEVLLPQLITPIPGSGPEVCGLIGLRGRVVTVFDLAVLLGGSPVDLGGDYRILVVETGSGTVGLAVAEVVMMVDDAGHDPGAGPGPPDALDLDRLIGPMLA